MADEVASLLVRITADGSQAVGVLNGVASTVDTLANKNAALLNKVSSVGTLAGSVGGAITKTFGVATVAGLTASAKAAGQLNKELANIGTLSVPTDRLKEFKGDIQDIAIATAKSTSDISEGTYQVISAFGDAPDTMKKVEINAKAAKAGLATTADSIALTSAVTKAYGDTSADAVQHVADLAFKTVELGQTTFPELAQNMQQVTSLSKELGVSQEELFGAYATLTGVTGNAAEVQTQIKAVYTALLKPSENMTAAIKKQGYESGYAMIKAKGFAGTLNALKEATGGNEEEMLGLFNNVRAMPAVMALTGSQADTFAAKLEKMEKASGAATKAFEVQTEGVSKTGYTLEQAKVKMQVAAQRFGESAAPLIGDVADIVDRASTSLANLTDEQRQSIINTGVMTTKIGVGLAVGGKALTLGTKFASTAKLVGGAIASTGPAGLAAAAGIAAVTGAVIIGKKAYDDYYDSRYNFAEGLREESEQLKNSYNSYKQLNDLQYEYNDLTSKVTSGVLQNEELNRAKSRLEEIKNILKDEYKIDVDSGDIDEAIEKAKELSKFDFLTKENELNTKSENLKPNYERAVAELPKLTEEYNSANAAAEKYDGALTALAEAQNKYGNTKNLDEFNQSFINILKNLEGETGEDFAAWWLDVQEGIQGADVQMLGAVQTIEGLKKGLKGLDYKDEDGKISKATATMQEYKEVCQQLADIKVTRFEDAFKSGGDTEQYVAGIKQYIDAGILSADEYAKKLTQVTSGVDDINKAWKQSADGDNTALDSFITGYIDNMQKLGATTEETVQGAALLREGFAKAADVPDDKIHSVINSLRELGNTQGLDMTSEKLTEMAQAMNLIPDGKKIEISADGEIKIIDEVKEKVEDLPDEHNTDIVATDKTSEGVNSAKENLATIEDKTVTLTVAYKTTGESNYNKFYTGGSFAVPKAKGDMNFSGGLAKVNDDGKPDPRELIIDRGRAFIPEGRDVILPLSRGAKVYTSDQTKAIMRGIGIPHYAAGKNNSDAFTSARDDWTHYTKTHAVTTMQELEKWLEFQKQYKKNEKDIWDIEEQVFSLQQKITKELNDQSKAYIEERSALNDWDEYGDSAIAAFERVRDRNKQELDAGRITWQEYVDNISSIGSSMYSERVSQSEKWLTHEEKYNGMSAADYIAGIDRMKAYTAYYYAQGIINYKEYTEALNDLDEKRLDKVKEGLSEQFDDSKAYISEHTYFNDWQDVNDDPLSAYNRVMERNREALEKGELTQAEFDEYAKTLGTDMYSERREQSENWSEEQRKYFGMEADEYIAGLERQKQYTEEYYRKGLIDRRTYNEGMTELNHAIWDEAAAAYDDMLSQQQEYISDLQEQFSKQEQELRDSWAVEDRKTDMSEVSAQLDIYAGAVTDRGQQKFKELEEQMKQLQRDEELYQLEVRNNAVIEELQADYEQLEADKTSFLSAIATNTDINVSGIVNSLISGISNNTNNLNCTLSEIIDAIHGIKMEQQNYTDSRSITNNINHLSDEQFDELGIYIGR